MIINLEPNEIKTLLELIKTVDPMGIFIGDIGKKLFSQIQEWAITTPACGGIYSPDGGYNPFPSFDTPEGYLLQFLRQKAHAARLCERL
jgi:hypothetical protein